MKLWLAVYIFGKVAASVGPLPYGMEECEIRAAERSAEFDHGFEANPERVEIDGKAVERKDIRVACVEQADRPVLEDFVRGKGEPR